MIVCFIFKVNFAICLWNLLVSLLNSSKPVPLANECSQLCKEKSSVKSYKFRELNLGSKMFYN